MKWPIERQIPRSYEAEGWRFVINDRVERCDAWVIYQGLYRPDETRCPPERLFFFTYEPPALHSYHPQFLSQFAKVVTCHKGMHHTGLLLRHQAQPWLAGLVRDVSVNLHASDAVRYDVEDLRSLQSTPKSRQVSVICSRRTDVPGHVARLELLDLLLARSDVDLDCFGYGHRAVSDKLEALLPYAFHLVLENCAINDYWTEKLADAYLARCFPLVWGCSNLGRYFPEESFVSLDANAPHRAMAQIAEAIAQGITPQRRAAIEEARRRVLDEYNLFSEIRQLCAATQASHRSRVYVRDENLFRGGSWLRPVVRRLKDWRSSETHDYYMRGGWKQARRRMLPSANPEAV